MAIPPLRPREPHGAEKTGRWRPTVQAVEKRGAAARVGLAAAPADGGWIKMTASTTVAAVAGQPLTKSFLQPLPSFHKTPRARGCSHPIAQMRKQVHKLTQGVDDPAPCGLGPSPSSH